MQAAAAELSGYAGKSAAFWRAGFKNSLLLASLTKLIAQG
jgi:hypothetical protein